MRLPCVPFVCVVVAIALTQCALATVTNVAWYRLGENDPGAVPGLAMTNETTDTVGGKNLQQFGSPLFIAVASSSAGIIDTNIPELLWYKMLENQNGNGNTNNPVLLADSSQHGGTSGMISIPYAYPWVMNQNGVAQAWHYNGSATHLDTGNPTLFNFTTNLFSINLWVQPYGYNATFMCNGAYQSNGWQLTENSSGVIGLGAGNNGSEYTVYSQGAGIATVNQWTMLTVVRDGPTSVEMYQNGYQIPTVGVFTNPASSSSNLLFGTDQTSLNDYDGDMGMVRIYARPISQLEIWQIYDNEFTNGTVSNSSLVAHWQLDGNTLDSGTNGNNGTTTNSPAYVTSQNGVPGYAMAFNGTNQYFDGGVLTNLSGTQYATIAAWVYRTNLTDSAAVGENVQPYAFGFLWASDNNIYVQCMNGPATGGTGGYWSPGASFGWHHIALVYDGTQSIVLNRVALYFDGTYHAINASGGAGDFPATLSAGANQPAFRMGMDNNGSVRFWAGQVDDVYVYARALSNGEIGQLHTHARGP
jgi:hypothetical protein